MRLRRSREAEKKKQDTRRERRQKRRGEAGGAATDVPPPPELQPTTAQVMQEAVAVMAGAAAMVESAAAAVHDAATRDDQLLSDPGELPPSVQQVATVVQEAAAVVEEAAAVVEEAAAAIQVAATGAAAVADDVTPGTDSEEDRTVAELSPVVQQAANVVHDAAAAVQQAAAVVQDTVAAVDAAAARHWPVVERRTKPRLPSTRHEARVHWKHVVIYLPLLALAVIVGALAIWSFIQRQSLATVPAALPKVTLVTADPSAKLTASWVAALTTAEMQPTLITPDRFDVADGVVVLCNVPNLPPRSMELLNRFARAGGALVIIGMPPAQRIGEFQLVARPGLSDDAVKLSAAASPVVARLTPGYQLGARRTRVAFLEETPRMTVDARWRGSSRAAVMHIQSGGGTRLVWFGLDPSALFDPADAQLLALLRTAFRWADGQPVSDGAVGPAELAKSLAPDARRAAREERFAFSVDPMQNERTFSITMTNRGGRPIRNPTVKIWLPPSVADVRLGGDMIMKRNATLTKMSDEGACLITLPALTRNEERVMKLRVLRTRPAPAESERVDQ